MATKRTALPAREYTKQEFADAVVRARGERNWSQAKLADHASESLPGKDKVTQADVSQIEKLKSYGLKKAVAVATALEIPPPKKVPDGEAPAPSAAKPRKSRAQQASTPGALAAPTPQQTAATAESPAPASEPADLTMKRGAAIDQIDATLDAVRTTVEGILRRVEAKHVANVIEMTQASHPELREWLATMAPPQGAA